MSAPANIMQSAFEGVMGDIPSVWTANNSIRDYGRKTAKLRIEYRRVSGYYAGRVWICRRKLFLGRLSWESRGSIGRTANIAIGRAIRNRYGCRCRDLSIPCRREHAVARRAKKSESSSSTGMGNVEWALEKRLAHYSRRMRGGRTAGPSGRIGDPWWNGEKSKNPDTCGTRPPSYLASDARPCLTFLPAS